MKLKHTSIYTLSLVLGLAGCSNPPQGSEIKADPKVSNSTSPIAEVDSPESLKNAEFISSGLKNFICKDAYDAASKRLEDLRAADQADRKTRPPNIAEADLARRVEVMEIFSKGCFKSGRDYHNGALIFQHGSVPEHYYQAYLWAETAMSLGDEDANWLVSRSVDRYLMKSGYKQIFATNTVTDSMFDPDAGKPPKWCLWQTVDGVSDEVRAAYGAKPFDAQMEQVKNNNEAFGHAREGGYCDFDVPNPPKHLLAKFRDLN